MTALALSTRLGGISKALRQASPREYAEFLTRYLSGGGKITHCYPYDFQRCAGFWIATENCSIPSGCGSYAINVIVPEGVVVTRYLDRSRGCWDHGHSYNMIDGSVFSEWGPWVPLYPDVARLMEEAGWLFVDKEFSDAALPMCMEMLKLSRRHR
jgi:hypothetical protein